MADILNDIPGTNSNDDSEVLKEFKQEFHDFSKEATEHYKFVESYLRGAYSDNRGGYRNQSSAFARQNIGSDFRNPFGRRSSYGRGAAFDRFSDSFEKAIFEGLGGANLKKHVQDSLKKFAKDLGTDLENLPEKFGEELGKYAIRAFKNTKAGKKFVDKLNDLTDRFFDRINKAYDQGKAKYSNGRSGGSNFSKIFSQGASKFTGTSSGGGLVPSGGAPINLEALFGSGEASAAMGGLMEAAGAVAPELLLAAKAAEFLSAGFEWATEDLKEAAKKFGQTLMKTMTRDVESRKKRLEAEEERWMADVKTLVNEPFNILKNAAQEVYEVWDNQLRIINATQGYSKSDLQDLMAVYAERIRDEGLASVVSGADITSNLAKVLESGLSGAVAEEFAYIATILNAAIPTQDFFEYGATYSSIAANLMANGLSQVDAIAAANKELTTFANSILYANRELTGGFSTGLKNASDLFTKAVQITQAAKTGSASDIAGVLTSVSAITGALAPDLASSMVDAVVKAATGGNASDIVALRSLAGINASNTEFLRKLATDPQQVFSTLFTNLARMQNMSNDAFMEVAEGLSSVFGISMESFARLDFTQLAKSIMNMNTNSNALNENMNQLISGQTTTTAEQLKMQQINQYMIEEGLAYVVDNAAARMIQEHMWDEQIARQITEAEYAVDLTGSAFGLLNGLYSFGSKILNILSFGLLGLTRIAETADEFGRQRDQIGQLLAAGKVGASTADTATLTAIANSMFPNMYKAEYLGTDKFYQQLITTGEDLNLVTDLVTMMTKPNAYLAFTKNLRKATSPTSAYGGLVGKSLASALLGGYSGSTTYSGGVMGAVSASVAAASGLKEKIDSMLAEEYIKGFTGEGGGGITAWKASASKFGISNLSKALESVGYKEEDVNEIFEQQQAKEVAQQELQRKHKEEDFWDDTMSYHTKILALVETTNTKISELYDKNKEFFDAWVDYYIEHTAYRSALDLTEVNKLLKDRNADTSDAIYALADALMSPENLNDPQLQTNALLAQILNVMQLIMTKQSNTPALSLPDTLQLLSMGSLG